MRDTFYRKIHKNIYDVEKERDQGIMRKIKISAHAHLYKIYYIKHIATYTKYTHTRDVTQFVGVSFKYTHTYPTCTQLYLLEIYIKIITNITSI